MWVKVAVVAVVHDPLTLVQAAQAGLGLVAVGQAVPRTVKTLV